mgnify:CR=1 FL=1
MIRILSAMSAWLRRERGAPGTTTDRWLLTLLAVAWLAFSAPLLFGDRTLLVRDVFTTHLTAKYFGAQALAVGEIPAFDTMRALGQPFAGNPNSLAFYPGNFLYLVLPFWIAFNAHYVLHWLLAFVGFRLLGKELGQSPLAASFAAMTFAASGYVLTLLTFYNLLAVVAWLPFVLWGLARGGRRGLLWGGLACGMMLLSGEPLTAALGIPPMVLVATERHGLKRGLLACLAVGGLGLAVALPQLVAVVRVFGFTFRGAHGVTPIEASSHSLPLARWLELLLPLPWGWPSNLERFAFWSKVTPTTPYIYSLHCGIVALVAATAAVRRMRWTWLAVAGLVLGWAGGLSGDWVLTLTGGLFRFPQKLILWTTVALALLAGWGFDRLFPAAGAPAKARGIRVLAGLFGAVTLLLWIAREAVRDLFIGRLGARDPAAAATQQTQWMLAALLSALLLWVASSAVRKRRPALFVIAQGAALLQLTPLLTTARLSTFAPPAPWIEKLGGERDVAAVWHLVPAWDEDEKDRPVLSETQGWSDARLDLDPATGALHGLAYPVTSDLEGIYSPLSTLLNRNLASHGWPMRVRWLRRLGTDWLVRREGEPESPPLPLIASETRLGVASELYRVPGSAPAVRWPRELVVADSPIAALALDLASAAAGLDALSVGIASRPVAHVAGASLELLSRRFDRLRFAVDGGGGLAIVERAYFPIVEARLENGERLPTQPADLVLLGIEIPPGRHVVTVETSMRPEAIAAAIALLTALILGFLGWRSP